MQERDIGDEYGWKQVHGDVFRPAAFPVVFASLIGVGVQILFVTISTVGLAIVGELYTEYVEKISIWLSFLLHSLAV